VARVRLFLFLATGAALPLYAFPIFSVANRPVDAATVAAAMFVAASVPEVRRFSRAVVFGGFAAALVPLAALVPPRAPRFDLSSFEISYAHWLLVVAFFVAAAAAPPGPAGVRRRAVVGTLAFTGALVAAYAIYQVVGMPRHWPGTGAMLVSFQREPLRLMQVGDTGYFRPTSVFLEPAWLGGFLVFVLAVTAGVPRPRESRIVRIAVVVLVALFTAVALATVSWGSYVDLAAAGGVLLVAAARRGESRRWLLAGAAGLVLVVGAAALTGPGRVVRGAIAERWELFTRTPVATDEGAAGLADSTWMRARNLRHTREIFEAYPLRGVGLGQFRRYALENAPYMIQRATRDPWCGWLASAAEMGVLGPLLIASPIALLLVLWWKSRRPRLPLVAALAVLAVVQQLHTGSYLDLWWWYPLSVGAAIGGDPAERAERSDGPATMPSRS
jgi:hypothetical protein